MCLCFHIMVIWRVLLQIGYSKARSVKKSSELSLLRNIPANKSVILYSNIHQLMIYTNVSTHAPQDCTAGIHGRLGDYLPKGALINITPCGSLNNYLNENSSLQNVVYIILSFPKKTHYWEIKSPHAYAVLMKYDSSLAAYHIILKPSRWSPLFGLYMYSLDNMLPRLFQHTDISQEEKNQVNFIDWNHKPQAFNLYLSSDKQIWHTSEICIFRGFVEKTLQYGWRNYV